MCPDKEDISAFYDRETEQRVAAAVSSHIENCRSCSVYCKSLEKLSRSLQLSEVPCEEEIKRRLYKSLCRKRQAELCSSFWSRRMSVSLPVFISAAAVIIVLCAAVVFGFASGQNGSQLASGGIAEIPQDVAGVQLVNMKDAAAYILANDEGFDILITIPANDGFSVTGEPKLIREADYKRGQ